MIRNCLIRIWSLLIAFFVISPLFGQYNLVTLEVTDASKHVDTVYQRLSVQTIEADSSLTTDSLYQLCVKWNDSIATFYGDTLQFRPSDNIVLDKLATPIQLPHEEVTSLRILRMRPYSSGRMSIGSVHAAEDQKWMFEEPIAKLWLITQPGWYYCTLYFFDDTTFRKVKRKLRFKSPFKRKQLLTKRRRAYVKKLSEEASDQKIVVIQILNIDF